MWTKRKPGWMRVTAWAVLFIQFISPLFLALTPAARATEYQDYQTMSETMAGLQALINEPRMLQRSSTPAPASVATHSTASTSTPPASSLSTSTIAPQPATPGGLPDLGIPKRHDGDPPSTEQWLAPKAMQAGQLLAEENVGASSVNFARSISEGMISQQVNEWLNHYGSARVSLGTDKLITGDLLLPFYDSENALLFSQVGLHSADERNFANLGLGYRQYTQGWMFGINTFYDYDYTGKNARLGVGGEAWTDYLKLSANAYYGLTDWRQSPLKSMQDYDERPAKGVDMRAQGWLPELPQLGATLKYERYFGKNIVLATQSDPQAFKDNPQAVTLGLNYTPFPLLTFSGERALGDTSDTRLDLTMNYRFGVPLWQQLDPAYVDLQRSLVGSKYAFVDRNYNIVMQYKKQQLVALSLPQLITAEAGSTLRIPVTIARAKHGLKKLEWSASANFTANGGSWHQPSISELEVQVPGFTADNLRTQSKVQDYVLTVVGVDENGNRSLPVSTTLQVSPSSDVIRQMGVEPNAVQPADSKHAYTINAQAVDKNGQPLVARRITFSVVQLTDSSGASAATLFTQKETDNTRLSVYTDSNGIASVSVQSRKAGEGTIIARMDNGNSSSTRVSFIADVTTAKLTALDVIANNAMADGSQANELRASVGDFYGNPLANFSVAFANDNGATMQGGNIAMTDQEGHATLRLTHTRASTSNVTATVNNASLSQAVTFLLDMATVDFANSDYTQDARANGSDSNLLMVKLIDAWGNPVPGVTVKFSPDAAVTLSPAQVQTDAKGKAQTTMTSLRAGEFSVTASIVGNDHTTLIKTRFVADASTAFLTEESLTISPDGAAANGRDTNGMTATVTDANGNPVEGAMVTFSATPDAWVINQQMKTGPDGKVSTSIASLKAGTFTVTAEVNNHTLHKNTLFMADKATAYISEKSLTVERDNAAANNRAANLVSVNVTDINLNPVAGVAVDFTVSEGATFKNVKSITDTNGKATAEVISQKADKYTVSVALNGTSVSEEVTFVGDVSTATLTRVTLDDQVVDKVANNADYFTFSAQVKDAYGNAVPGVSVRWKHNSGTGVTLNNQTVTSLAGIATTVLHSSRTTSLNIQVSASLDESHPVDADKTVNFNPQKVLLRGSVSGVAAGVTHLVQNATVSFYKNKQDTLAAYTVMTNNGGYSLLITPGEWYVTASSTEYITAEKSISVSTTEKQTQNFSLIKRLEGNAAVITLKWEAGPLDLDAHLMIPALGNSANRIHIASYSKSTQGADVVTSGNITTGLGPEKLTILKMHPGAYCYSVYNPQPKLGNTVIGAAVNIMLADGREFNWQASNRSQDLLWFVFKIVVSEDGIVSILPVDKTYPDAKAGFDNC
ncbi:Ig-like domain-containing protein [Vagococcus sp. WN89Y]|uniref:Ig-like domain-containing protein n=1 Tax=Vagococcus sp. WN89Y TaxID=3457258 RepID=UPI003FCE7FF6